ncbi:ZIP family metal transporter [Candidatus Bathyarchaeota archaeon]|nr:ZIP family metal transporter [Candidatus Bathyarchaeota archaeon]
MSSVFEFMLLATLAGLATGVGGLIVLVKKPSRELLGSLLGLAAGIMISLSFLELFSEALRLSGLFLAATAFVTGFFIMFLLDYLLPHKHFFVEEKGVIDGGMFKSGRLIAIGISLHNFPEGIAIASSYSYMPEFGLMVALAMAIHNIPEGMAISLPLRAGGASKMEAFRLALFSGLMEPLGALVAAVFLVFFQGLVPLGLAFAGGVMVFVTLDELIPIAHKGGHEHFTSLGVILGCIVTFLLLGLL